jgi:hypothetical protein
MSAESNPKPDRAVPRVDSFEVIDVDCTSILTEEEKSWPMAALLPRTDSFEIIQAGSIE